MLAIGLGLLVATVYGSADFFGGLASRRRSATVVVLWTQVTGLVALALVAPLLGGAPEGRDLWLGVLSGLVGVCGVLLLYRGLAGGRMSVVAPITAVGAAFVPFVVGAGGGEGLPASRLAGAALALAGVALVSRPPAHRAGDAPRTGRGRDLALGAGAGGAFGIVFVLLSRLGDDAGLWPVLVQRLGSVPVVLVMTAVVGLPRRVGRLDLRLIVPAGLCDAAANALFVAASRAGALSVVGVVSSLYPAPTVLLAALILKERVTEPQGVGLVLAGAGVVLLAL
ncbi:MAG: EamA family transporter [Acidimicrobiales bacterium]